MTAVRYVIDTNVIIDGRNQHYPPDVLPAIWDLMGELIDAGRAVTPREVHDELKRGSDDCAEWCAKQPSFIVDVSPRTLSHVSSIASSYPDWVQGTKNGADPFVVAHAIERGATVVTNERLYGGGNPALIRIPNVCRDLAVHACASSR